MLQHRDDDEVEDELDDGDDSEASSDEEVCYQSVAVGGRSGRRGVGGGATFGAQRGAAAEKSLRNYDDGQRGAAAKQSIRSFDDDGQCGAAARKSVDVDTATCYHNIEEQ